MPDLTVVMPVYNSGPYLAKAIESILNQTYRSFELLILDDCSTDGSRRVIEQYDDPRIRLVVNEENIGQTRTLNRGLKLADSELIVRMDHDDISHPERLQRQVEFLKENVDVAVVGTCIRWIDASGKVLGKKRMPDDALVLRFAQLFRCPLAHGTVAFRRSIILDELGGYDESIPFSQDWELWARVLIRHKIVNIPEYLADVRVHEASTTTTKRHEIGGENSRIYQMSLQCVLEIETIPRKWLDSIEALSSMKWERCVEMVEMGESLYGLYCRRYPEASASLGIVMELARNYLRILYHCQGGIVQLVRAAQQGGGKITYYGLCSVYYTLQKRFRSDPL
jgi:glycosyltransferase involved in cell wall biosynthesis